MFPAAPVAIHGCAVNTRRGPISLLWSRCAIFATVAGQRLRIVSDLASGALLSHAFFSISIARASSSAASARSALLMQARTASAAH